MAKNNVYTKLFTWSVATTSLACTLVGSWSNINKFSKKKESLVRSNFFTVRIILRNVIADAAIIRNREQPAPQLTVTDILCEKTKQQILIDITPDFIWRKNHNERKVPLQWLNIANVTEEGWRLGIWSSELLRRVGRMATARTRHIPWIVGKREPICIPMRLDPPRQIWKQYTPILLLVHHL